MKTVFKIIFVLFIILVVTTNYFQVISNWSWYHYTTADGKFQFDEYPAKGRDFTMMDGLWKDYKEKNKHADTVIYRAFAMNPLKFWLWRDYLYHDRYKYPYLSTTEKY